MQHLIELRDDRSDHTRHQARKRLQNSDGLPQRGGYGGKLEANETSADDNNLLGVSHALFHHNGLVERTQIKNPVELRAFDGKQTVTCADGEDELVEGGPAP